MPDTDQRDGETSPRPAPAPPAAVRSDAGSAVPRAPGIVLAVAGGLFAILAGGVWVLGGLPVTGLIRNVDVAQALPGVTPATMVVALVLGPLIILLGVGACRGRPGACTWGAMLLALSGLYPASSIDRLGNAGIFLLVLQVPAMLCLALGRWQIERCEDEERILALRRVERALGLPPPDASSGS